MEPLVTLLGAADAHLAPTAAAAIERRAAAAAAAAARATPERDGTGASRSRAAMWADRATRTVGRSRRLSMIT